MRLRWWRRTPPVRPRSSRVDIAVLEHDLYGIQPAPGSMAATAIGLRTLANSGTTASEMMHRMRDCPATGTIELDGQPVRVICNLPPHDGEQHHDNMLGAWSSKEQK